MQAAVHTRYGAPDVVRIVEVAAPVPRTNEVLVRVHATTVNRTDCGFRVAEAAPGAEGAHYALAFIRKAKIRRGQTVLVDGATGGIGSAAVQLLKGLGVQVTAVCDTAHLGLVSGLGADRVVDCTREDFTQDEQQYDAVLDAVGKSTFRPLPEPVEARRPLSLLRARPVLAEPGSRTRHPAASRKDGDLPDPQGQPGDREAPQGPDRVGDLQARHR